ncbi:unnamed protein product [Caenorhabditis sp. 36 PRJEB53466]|nr:unnamed protein product [Caenorhabditis sp. 36 PRJEB53466]
MTTTPTRTKILSPRVKESEPNSAIRRPFQKKRIASPIRFNPISRISLKEVQNAPKVKRVRESRLFPASKMSGDERDIPLPGGSHETPKRSSYLLPIPRLQFENDDFMEMFAEETEIIHRRPDSVALLAEYLSASFHTLTTEPSSSDSEYQHQNSECSYVTLRLTAPSEIISNTQN